MPEKNPLGDALTFAGLILIGFGSAPFYPSLMHETPKNFGAGRSQAVIVVQIASAYLGTTFMPLVFGWIAGDANIWALPVYLIVFIGLTILMTENLNKLKRRETV